MAAPDTVVDFAEKLGSTSCGHKDHRAGQRPARQGGEGPGRVRLAQPTPDETFIVLAGRLTVRLEGRDDVPLGPGQMFIVPRGLPHCPVAPEECHLLLLEPAGTPNTGDQPGSDRTATDEWI